MAKDIPSHKVFKLDEFVVKDGQGNRISTITGLAVTIIAGFEDETTALAMTFHTHNHTHSKSERGNVVLIVDILNKDGGAVPIPTGPKISINNWRMNCLYGNEAYRRADGVISVPYAEFVEKADHIGVRHTNMDGPQDNC